MVESNGFEQLYREHVDGIFRFIRQMMGSEDDAEELTAETFFRAYRSFSKLRDVSKAKAWLYRIAYNLCVDELEKRKRLSIVSMEDEPAIERISTGEPSPSAILEGKEVTIWVRDVLSRLPHDYQTALILGEVEGLSNGEIAKVMGRTPTAVKSLRQRARNAFKRETMKSLKRLGLNLEDLLK
jgi:RNA polymerase sigma-70 factor (ECF subfamily)